MLKVTLKQLFCLKKLLKISRASKEQEEAIKQMTFQVDKILELVKTNSATDEETVASIQELATQSQVITEKLSVLKLRHT